MAKESGSGGGGQGRVGRPSRAPQRVKSPSINLRLPDVGKGVGDAIGSVGRGIGNVISHVVPQDALYRKIGDKLSAPSGRIPSGAGVSSLFTAPPKRVAPKPAAPGQRKGRNTVTARFLGGEVTRRYIPTVSPGQRRGRATLIGRDPLTFTAPGQRKGPTPLDVAPRSGQRKARVPVLRPVVTSKFDPLTAGDTADTGRRPLGTRRFRAK